MNAPVDFVDLAYPDLGCTFRVDAGVLLYQSHGGDEKEWSEVVASPGIWALGVINDHYDTAFTLESFDGR